MSREQMTLGAAVQEGLPAERTSEHRPGMVIGSGSETFQEEEILSTEALMQKGTWTIHRLIGMPMWLEGSEGQMDKTQM